MVFGMSRTQFVFLVVIIVVASVSTIHGYLVSNDLSLSVGTNLLGSLVAALLFQIVLVQIGTNKHGFRHQLYIVKVKNSKQRVRVLNTFVRLLTDQENEPHKKEFFETIKSHVTNNFGFDVQILLLDPYSEAAKQRDKELSEDVISLIEKSIFEIYNFKSELRNQLGSDAYQRVEIRVYDALPPFSLYQADDWASISHFPRGHSSTDKRTERHEFSIRTPLGHFFTQTFDNLWHDSRTKQLEQHMLLTLRHEDANQSYEIKYILKTPTGSELHYAIMLDVEKDKELIRLLSNGGGISIKRWKDNAYIMCKRYIEIESRSENYAEIKTRIESKYGVISGQRCFELTTIKVEI